MSITARERLTSMLAAQTERSSSVQLTAKNPAALRLSVTGIGRIGLPVTAARARRLRAVARPARFGQGTQTLTDPDVRNTWEVPTELVSVEWTDGRALEPELEIIREELGLPAHCSLRAELHSLLVYEEGQFFLPHQDSEKHDSMVATLVVTLPSAHSGGELVVHHLGEATRYRGFEDRVGLVAFYADCRHEVLPVTSGHRVALTYNLLLSGDVGRAVGAGQIVEPAADCLREHFSTRPPHPYLNTTQDPPQRLVFMLDHEYSERGLDWSRLKGTDATSAALLRAAAQEAGAESVLALTEINQTWDAWAEDDEWGYGNGPLVEADGHELRLNEMIQSQVTLTWWNTDGDEAGEHVRLTVDDAEICSLTPTSDLPADQSQYEGYMGNYGNTLDRWYRRAAVVIWPGEMSFAVRAEASPAWAPQELVRRARAEDPVSARSLARTLEPFWSTAVAGLERPDQMLAAVLEAAESVDDAATALMLASPFRLEQVKPEHAAGLVGFLAGYGRQTTEELIGGWAAQRVRWGDLSRSSWLRSLPGLIDALLEQGRPGASLARMLITCGWQGLSTSMADAVRPRSAVQRRKSLTALGSPLAALLRAVCQARAASLRTQILADLRRRQDEVSWCLSAALIEAADFPEEIRDDPAFVRLAAGQTAVLRERLNRPRRAPDDWSILPGGPACCETCRELNDFLADPQERTLEWPLAKSGRQHVHIRIEDDELPVTHVTRRSGRPFTLVLTKTQRLFQDEEHERIRDGADLERLLRVWPS